MVAGEIEATSGDIIMSSKDLRTAFLKQEFRCVREYTPSHPPAPTHARTLPLQYTRFHFRILDHVSTPSHHHPPPLPTAHTTPPPLSTTLAPLDYFSEDLDEERSLKDEFLSVFTEANAELETIAKAEAALESSAGKHAEIIN